MTQGTILLVGEGDFSFAASLLRKEPKEFKTVIATCYRTKAKISINQEQNVNFITSRGGYVWTDVDATKLHEHSEIKSLNPTQIRFNFPHIDGKMNMKNNRNLLGLFFQSCYELLKDDDNYSVKVIVTMCAGQGGTPADGKFLRRWDDSWKITQLATEAGFLLRDTYLFNPEGYAKYNCTGFRKQEKGFRVDGSVVHEFNLGRRVDTSQFHENTPLVLPVRFSNCGTYTVPKYFADKINKFEERKLSKIPDISTQLLQTFEKLNFKTIRKTIAASPIETSNNLHRVKISNSQEFGPIEGDECQSYLNLTLLEQYELHQIENSNCEIITGLIFQNCPVSEENVPVQEHVLLRYQHSNDQTINLLEIIQQITHGEIQSIPAENIPNEELEPIWITYKCQISHSYINIPTYNDLTSKITIFIGPRNEVIGLSREFHTTSSSTNVLGCFNMDKLLQLRFNVSDWRLLWVIDDELNTLETPVKFPLETRHDISFWCCLNGQSSFNELCFTNCLRNYLGDILKLVTLVEEYMDQSNTDLRRLGRCYRLVYQSCHSALSKSMTNEIQNRLRAFLKRRYNSIVLR